jgi:hypothetical protein
LHQWSQVYISQHDTSQGWNASLQSLQSRQLCQESSVKAHLLTSEYPIVSGQNQTADCGKEIQSAQTLFMWDEAAMCEGMNYGKNVCQACQLADKGPRGRLIVYGIVSGAKS